MASPLSSSPPRAWATRATQPRGRWLRREDLPADGDQLAGTAPLAIVNLGRSQYQVFYNVIDAGVVATTLPIVLLVLFAQRKIVAGLTAGGLKGS
jgi:hypothetical protein